MNKIRFPNQRKTYSGLIRTEKLTIIVSGSIFQDLTLYFENT